MTSMLTVGHGTLAADALGDLLRGHGVQEVVDVRRFPGSRRHPHVKRSRLAVWLPERGIDYRWDERLGGRRRGPDPSPNSSVRNPSFRAYADHMSQAPWKQALSELMADASRRRVVVMCSEAVWWRCHRRFIADAAVLLHGTPVEHLMHDGRTHAHPPMPEARVLDGQLRYDR